MTEKEQKRSRSVVPAAATAVGCIAPLFFIGYYWPQLDYQILEQVVSFRTPGADQAAQWITQLGGFSILLPATIILALIMARFSQKLAIFAVLSMGISALTVQLIKFMTARARPDEQWAMYIADGYSFPSGHASAALTFGLICSLALDRLAPDLRKSLPGWGVLLLPVSAALVVGLTRPYLGVHFATDVVAGWALAIGTVVVLYRIVIERAHDAGMPDDISAGEDQVSSDI